MAEQAGPMKGCVCLVTGASTGIGFHTARGLLEKGAHVIGVGHNEARGQSARVVNVASRAHRRARLHFDDLQLEHGYTLLKAYDQSKLCNVMFTYALARRVEGSGVTANALHPRFVKTSLGKQNVAVRVVMEMVHALAAKSPQEGAVTPIYLASSPEVAGVNGGYFVDKEVVASSPCTYDEDAQERLWRISAEMTGL